MMGYGQESIQQDLASLKQLKLLCRLCDFLYKAIDQDDWDLSNNGQLYKVSAFVDKGIRCSFLLRSSR
jgi:hypothetical protein